MYVQNFIRLCSLAFIFIGLTTQSHLFAQEKNSEPEPFWQHVRFGGSLGANFSNGYFSGYLAPRAVYDFNRFFSAGVGTAGSYTNASRYSAYSVSGSVLTLARPIPAVQLSAEFEESYVSRNLELEGANRSDSYWYPALFLGAGYTTGGVTVGLRYDLLYDEGKSMYNNALMPFVSIYF